MLQERFFDGQFFPETKKLKTRWV